MQNVLLCTFNSIDENEELSRSMKHSIIDLIYKNKDDTTDLKKNQTDKIVKCRL